MSIPDQILSLSKNVAQLHREVEVLTLKISPDNVSQITKLYEQINQNYYSISKNKILIESKNLISSFQLLSEKINVLRSQIIGNMRPLSSSSYSYSDEGNETKRDIDHPYFKPILNSQAKKLSSEEVNRLTTILNPSTNYYYSNQNIPDFTFIFSISDLLNKFHNKLRQLDIEFKTQLSGSAALFVINGFSQSYNDIDIHIQIDEPILPERIQSLFLECIAQFANIDPLILRTKLLKALNLFDKMMLFTLPAAPNDIDFMISWGEGPFCITSADSFRIDLCSKELKCIEGYHFKSSLKLLRSNQFIVTPPEKASKILNGLRSYVRLLTSKNLHTENPLVEFNFIQGFSSPSFSSLVSYIERHFMQPITQSVFLLNFHTILKAHDIETTEIEKMIGNIYNIQSEISYFVKNLKAYIFWTSSPHFQKIENQSGHFPVRFKRVKNNHTLFIPIPWEETILLFTKPHEHLLEIENISNLKIIVSKQLSNFMDNSILSYLVKFLAELEIQDLPEYISKVPSEIQSPFLHEFENNFNLSTSHIKSKIHEPILYRQIEWIRDLKNTHPNEANILKTKIHQSIQSMKSLSENEILEFIHLFKNDLFTKEDFIHFLKKIHSRYWKNNTIIQLAWQNLQSFFDLHQNEKSTNESLTVIFQKKIIHSLINEESSPLFLLYEILKNQKLGSDRIDLLKSVIHFFDLSIPSLFNDFSQNQEDFILPFIDDLSRMKNSKSVVDKIFFDSIQSLNSSIIEKILNLYPEKESYFSQCSLTNPHLHSVIKILNSLKQDELFLKFIKKNITIFLNTDFELLEKILNQNPHFLEPIWAMCKPLSKWKKIDHCITIAKTFNLKNPNTPILLLSDLTDFDFENLNTNSSELFNQLFNSISIAEITPHLNLFLNYYKKSAESCKKTTLLLINKIEIIEKLSFKELKELINTTPIHLNNIDNNQKNIFINHLFEVIQKLETNLQIQIFPKISQFLETHPSCITEKILFQLIPIYQSFVNYEKNMIMLEEAWETFYYFYLQYPITQELLNPIFLKEIERFRDQKISIPSKLLFGFFYQIIDLEQPKTQKAQLYDLAFGYFMQQAILQASEEDAIHFANFSIEKNLFPEFKHLLILKSAYLAYRNSFNRDLIVFNSSFFSCQTSSQSDLLISAKFFSILQVLIERTYSIFPIDKLHSFKIFNQFILGALMELSIHDIDPFLVPSILNKHIDILIFLYKKSENHRDLFQKLAIDFYSLMSNTPPLHSAKLTIDFYLKFFHIVPENLASKIYSILFQQVSEFFESEKIINRLLDELPKFDLSAEMEVFLLSLYNLQEVGPKESILYTSQIQLSLRECILFLQKNNHSNEVLFFFTEWFFLIFYLRKTIQDPALLPEINFDEIISQSVNILSDKFSTPKILTHLWNFLHRMQKSGFGRVKTLTSNPNK